MNIIGKIRQHGIKVVMKKTMSMLQQKSGYYLWKHRNAQVYCNPTDEELVMIERDLMTQGLVLSDYSPPPLYVNRDVAFC